MQSVEPGVQRSFSSRLGVEPGLALLWLAAFFLLLFAAAGLSSAPAAGPLCTVNLERLSYDDPGVDDAEWLELSVENPNGGARFSDCDVAALELLDGDDASCPARLRIELAELAIPASGTLLVCASESSVAATGCDVGAGSSGSLSNGWLQNGAEVLRLVNSAGLEIWSSSYGGVPSCDVSATLPKDQGGVDTTLGEEDDVLARCGDTVVRLPVSSAPPREAASCPTSDAPATSPAATGTALPGVAAPATSGLPPLGEAETTAATASSTPNREPPAAFDTGWIHDAGVTVVSRSVLVEAGSTEANDLAEPDFGKTPEVPQLGCAMRSTARSTSRRALGGQAGAAALAVSPELGSPELVLLCFASLGFAARRAVRRRLGPARSLAAERCGDCCARRLPR
jgi:hypothetical protein